MPDLFLISDTQGAWRQEDVSPHLFSGTMQTGHLQGGGNLFPAHVPISIKPLGR